MLLGPVRIGWIQVQMTAGRPVCHLVGTAHHRPLYRRVSLLTATSLMAKGVPSRVYRDHAPAPLATKPRSAA